MDLKQGMETLRVNKTFRGILSTLLSIGIFLNGNEVGIECQPNDIRLIRLSRRPTPPGSRRGPRYLPGQYIYNFVLTAGSNCEMPLVPRLADCHIFLKTISV